MTPIRAYMLIVDGEPSLEDIYPYEEEALHQKEVEIHVV